MKKNIIHIILIFLFTAGCGDRSLFTELATNRIKVLIKGTYESNNPRPWEDAFLHYDDLILASDSVDDLLISDPSNEDTVPTKFMLDIAELRISDGPNTQRFANYRKIFSHGLNENSSFFNGTGITCVNDDVRPHYTWRYVKMYIRKMLFDSAKIYSYDDNAVTDGAGNWNFYKNDMDIFAEEDAEGLNFNIFQINSYYDSLLYQAGSINRIFPLVVSIDDPFIFDNDVPGTVLEIRFVVKNFIKKFELDYVSESVRYVKHFYALSDWLRDVKPGRRYSKEYSRYINDSEMMGRNIVAIARTYIPGQTVTITGSAGTGVTTCYVIAINENHSLGEYEITGTERTRPLLDEPKLPILDLPLDLENVLDYYLKYEKYKDDYDAFIDSVQYYTDQETGPYDEAWTAYNDRIEDFKIPALVTWTEDGSFTLTNVPVGHTYTIYRSACANGSCIANELPGDFVDSPIGSITVSAEDAGEPVSVK